MLADTLEKHPRLAVLVVRGMGYGYPHCCITAFCEDTAAGRSPAREREKLGWRSDGSGYVPCQACVGAPEAQFPSGRGC